MKKIIVPILLLGLGTGAGIGAAIFLKEEPVAQDQAHAVDCVAPQNTQELEEMLTEPDPDDVVSAEYVTLDNQFVVPIVKDDKIDALIVLTVNIEVPAGGKDIVTLAEPKLRDKFLQVLFEHANLGGFSGNFTSSSNMRILREDLLAAALFLACARTAGLRANSRANSKFNSSIFESIH